MDIDEFIHEVLVRPALWMSNHPKHRYKIANLKLWEEVKQHFPTLEVKQLKSKWKNLKDTYRKELKKVTTTAVPSQWQHFNSLSFLSEECAPSGEDEYEVIDIADEKPLSTLRQSPSFASEPVPQDTAPQSPISQAEQPQKSCKRSTNDLRAEYLEIERKKLRILEQEVAEKSSSDTDIKKTDSYYFLMSLLPEMEKLKPVQKMRLRNSMSQALLEEITLASCEHSYARPNETANDSTMPVVKIEIIKE